MNKKIDKWVRDFEVLFSCMGLFGWCSRWSQPRWSRRTPLKPLWRWLSSPRRYATTTRTTWRTQAWVLSPRTRVYTRGHACTRQHPVPQHPIPQHPRTPTPPYPSQRKPGCTEMRSTVAARDSAVTRSWGELPSPWGGTTKWSWCYDTFCRILFS